MAQQSLVCSQAALYAFSSAHTYLDMAAKMTAAWKVGLEEQVVIHEMRPNRRPWVRRDGRILCALELNMARNC